MIEYKANKPPDKELLKEVVAEEIVNSVKLQYALTFVRIPGYVF